MSMRNESTDPIDALIADAARRLVAGEPSSSLRSGVRDRLDRRQSTWSLVPAFAGVAALLIVTGMIVGRTLSGPPAGPDNAGPTIERGQVPGVDQTLSGPADEPGERDSIRLTSEQLTEGRGPLRRLAADVGAPPEEESLIPPIAIEPLVTDPLAPVQIVVDQSSGVMPIEIAPLRIEPLQGD